MNIHLISFLSALVFSLLFYNKSFGLNLILIAILVVLLLVGMRKRRSISLPYAAGYIATSVFVFLDPSAFTLIAHFMAMLVFIGKSVSHKTSIYMAWFIGCINILIASIANYVKSGDRQRTAEEKEPSKKTTTKQFNRLKGGLAAAALLFTFGMLYRKANPVFENLVSEINLEFISFPWLLLTLIGYIAFFHLLRPFDAHEITAYDLAQANDLKKPSELELIGARKKLEGEHTMGSMVFLALNVLLVVFLATDVVYLLQDIAITDAAYSNAVHQGVYALMFSIVCAIVLILFFFRGNLNFFKGNRRIKVLTYIWIGLNTLLVVFTAYKNYAYVEALGLTYKRIGVFAYLLLTLIGLATAYIKVTQVKSFIYLVRTNIATVFAFMLIAAAIPWDKTITSFNLKNIDRPDLYYLIGLGESNSEQLYRYSIDHAAQIQAHSQTAITQKHNAFLKAQAGKTWQEYSYYQLTNNDTK